MSIALKIENVSKALYLHQAEPHWVLKGLNLDILKGDIIGIMGSNGAGKSTLLKILSKITSPTLGQVIGRGKLISLLEMGIAFYPELNGAESIYLNGAMLGRQKAEIKRKFDDIVSFSNLESHLLTPVKKYSSGMLLRLAFSIASHLEPDILILDEILAVADADFQQQCIHKLRSLNQENGTTILLVSHDKHLTDICSKGFVLHQGNTSGITDILSSIKEYESLSH